ncbi:MAG TPA: c-type cytochrome [Blastocatellia bacterium]|nr:c-type cytochrome [Blastocatellia bacterium]
MSGTDRSKWTLWLVVMAVWWSVLVGEAVRAGRDEGPPPAAADGAAVYSGKCALCHGKDGAGLPTWRSKGQPDFTKSEWQTSHTDLEITEAVRDGKGKFMPAFKKRLSDEEISAVVQRVRALGKTK